jgi:hypothetical protein
MRALDVCAESMHVQTTASYAGLLGSLPANTLVSCSLNSRYLALLSSPSVSVTTLKILLREGACLRAVFERNLEPAFPTTLAWLETRGVGPDFAAHAHTRRTSLLCVCASGELTVYPLLSDQVALPLCRTISLDSPDAQALCTDSFAHLAVPCPCAELLLRVEVNEKFEPSVRSRLPLARSRTSSGRWAVSGNVLAALTERGLGLWHAQSGALRPASFRRLTGVQAERCASSRSRLRT